MTSWQVPQEWWRGHTSSDLVYRVRLALPGSEVADDLWRDLSSTLLRGEEGDLYDGGAAIARVDATHVDVVSGGEDALDSLERTVGDTVANALRLRGLGWSAVVVTELSASEEDPGTTARPGAATIAS